MMKIVIPLILSIYYCVAISPDSQSIQKFHHNPIGFKEIKEIQKRQSVSYSTNVIHKDPKFPDQAAESSINVNFDPHPHDHETIMRQIRAQNAPPQSQSFNVGYSVSFTNKNPNQQIQQNRPKDLENGEIITGIRKYNEQVDVPNFGSKPKLPNLKQKFNFGNNKFGNIFDSKNLLSQAYLSPTTQKNYQILEQIKNVPPINQQALQQKYSWRNLGPGVEIIRSTEIPFNSENQNHFDHAKALGRSQGFDYTNAIEKQSQDPVIAKPSQINPSDPVHVSNNPYLNYKFPIDTRLLREPVILTATDPKNFNMNHNSGTVPIHFDARLIHDAMKNYRQYNEQKQLNDPAQSQHNQLESQQSQQRPVQVIYSQQVTKSLPDMPGFQDYQVQNSKYQYKIYGKPQPVVGNMQVEEFRMPEAPFSGNFNEGNIGQRRPRFPMAEYNLQTNLRPPPFGVTNFQRRIFMF